MTQHVKQTIFFSYPHDANVPLVLRLYEDLRARGHEVLMDTELIKVGDEWRNKITRGILESNQVVAFLSKHSVRDPGVCLNEIYIALADKGDDALVTVLVEPKEEVDAPSTITHIQWLKMDDHKDYAYDDQWYNKRLDELIKVIEEPRSINRSEELGKLKDILNPMTFYADIATHLERFTGRQWLFERYEQWLEQTQVSQFSKVFRIEGGPGMGKTAVVSQLAHIPYRHQALNRTSKFSVVSKLTHTTRSSVLALHLCESGKSSTCDPKRMVCSLAYQMASRYPDYRARLLKVTCIEDPQKMQGEDAGSLWSALISEPLSGAGKAGLIDRPRMVIVIDGLDEATVNGQNDILDLLVKNITKLPTWIGVVLTGRPDIELTSSLKHYKPQSIQCDDPLNQQDLKQYISDWLQEEVAAQRLQIHQVPTVTHALLEKSEGAFLYLVQLREEILQSVQDGTIAVDWNNLASLPQGMKVLYLMAFKRRFADHTKDPDSENNRWNRWVKPLLGYILASPEPLPLNLAQELIGWNTEQQNLTRRALGSLLNTKGKPENPFTCTLAPFHKSMREWLISEDALDFRIYPDKYVYPLTSKIWNTYIINKQINSYEWICLPYLLNACKDSQSILSGDPDLILEKMWSQDKKNDELDHSYPIDLATFYIHLNYLRLQQAKEKNIKNIEVMFEKLIDMSTLLVWDGDEDNGRYDFNLLNDIIEDDIDYIEFNKLIISSSILVFGNLNPVLIRSVLNIFNYYEVKKIAFGDIKNLINAELIKYCIKINEYRDCYKLFCFHLSSMDITNEKTKCLIRPLIRLIRNARSIYNEDMRYSFKRDFECRTYEEFIFSAFDFLKNNYIKYKDKIYINLMEKCLISYFDLYEADASIDRMEFCAINMKFSLEYEEDKLIQLFSVHLLSLSEYFNEEKYIVNKYFCNFYINIVHDIALVFFMKFINTDIGNGVIQASSFELTAIERHLKYSRIFYILFSDLSKFLVDAPIGLFLMCKFLHSFFSSNSVFNYLIDPVIFKIVGNINAFGASKLPKQVAVKFASANGVMQTLEGPVAYTEGDALLTGVAGERWPVTRAKFDASYQACPPTQNGESGYYTKLPSTVWVWCVNQKTTIPLSDNRGSLKAAPGDFIVRYSKGDYGVVAAEIFEKTYVRI